MPKNLLVIADDIRSHSGVANQTREIIKALSEEYNIYHIGMNVTQPPQLVSDLELSNGKTVTIYASPAYDDINLIFSLIEKKNIQGIILVTDPHRYGQVWQNVRTIRAKCPIIYYNVWDTDLVNAPNGKRHFNQHIYESCDTLACISAQTENFCRTVTATSNAKPHICYVPHGQNAEVFKPLDDITDFKNKLFGGKQYDFVCLLNSRNQTRKRIPDLIMAFKQFTDELSKDKADKCALVLKSEISSPNGTDLMEVCLALAPKCHIYINNHPFNEADMAKLYNCADVVAQTSNAEGFGLSINEAMLCGIPIMATVTGGLQDQIAFFDDAGQPIRFTPDFSSNAVGKYKNHGVWAYPLFPTARNIIGSPQTPYLYDDNTSIERIKEGLAYWYGIDPAERKRRGLKGREYCLNTGLNSIALGKTFTATVNKTLADFKKQNTFEIYE